MKSKSIGRLILLAFLAPSCGGGGKAAPIAPLLARWSSQYRLPTTVNLRAVRFDSTGMHGVVAGEAGTFIRTDDGGQTWTQNEYLPANRGGDILALNVALTTAIAVGADSATGGSAAWSSTDATTWFNTEDAVYPRFPAEPWVDVALVVPVTASTPSSSYRLRPSGMVDVYDNGYQTPSLDSTVSTPPAAAGVWAQAYGITFDALTGKGFVCGDRGGANGQVRWTGNNGANWNTLAVPAGCPPLRRFSMQSNIRGFACGDGGTVVGTPDALNWFNVPSKPGVGFTANLRGIAFQPDGNTGWVVGLGGAIYKLTLAAGTWTWTDQSGATAEDLYDVCFSDINTGYAVGNHGTVLKYTGASVPPWSVISQPKPLPAPLPQFKAVDFTPDGMTGLAVGNGGVVLRTLDGGMTWLNITSASVGATNLTGVCIPRSGSGNVAYICGTNTVLTQSMLKALVPSPWTAQTIAAGAYSAILFPADDAKGVVVGSSGELRITIDGGTTWTAPGTLPPTGTNYRAICSGGTMVFAAGDNGIVINSDYSGVAGATVWANSPTLPGGPPPQIHTIQAPLGATHSLFAGAADGKVYRLNAAMTVWDGSVAAIQGAANPVASIAFSNEASGLAVVQGASNGGVFYTLDGGATWARSYLHVKIGNGPPSNQLQEIRMISPSVGWAVGDGGMILMTSTGGQ